jgi:hypothetical protein
MYVASFMDFARLIEEETPLEIWIDGSWEPLRTSTKYAISEIINAIACEEIRYRLPALTEE